MTAPNAFLVDLNQSLTPHVGMSVDTAGAATLHTQDSSGNPVALVIGSGGGGGGTPGTQTPNALAATAAVGTSTAFMRQDAVLPLPSVNAVGGLPQASGNYDATQNLVLTGPYAGQHLVAGTLPTGTSTAPTCFNVTVAGTPGIDALGTLAIGDKVFYSSALVWDVMGGAAATTGLYKGDGTTSGRLIAAVPGLDFMPAPLFQTGVPIGVMPNCTVGASGVITFGTTTPTAYPQGAFMWYSANALFSGSAAGWWWTVLAGTQGSAASGGTVYNNYLVSTGNASQQSGLSVGATIAGGYEIPTSLTTTGITGGTHTQPTATVIYAPGPTLAANYLGNNGSLEAKYLLRNNNSANTKQFQAGGNFFAASTPTTATNTVLTVTTMNMGTPAHQIGDFTDIGSAIDITTAIDTTTAQVLNTKFNFASGGAGNDWQVCQYLRITAIPRA